MSEVHWAEAWSRIVNDHTEYDSGNNDIYHMNGVGFIVCKTIQKYILNFIPFSDRMMLLQIRENPANINNLKVYAWTTDRLENEIETFYDQLKELYKFPKKNELTIVIGDLNAATKYEWHPIYA